MIVYRNKDRAKPLDDSHEPLLVTTSATLLLILSALIGGT